ncbi:MAG TPA: DEAD/DEAH box helicase [Candidatus Ozemobacteraceae bacterium]|mgnify:CR=1 FL=1|nr:DEAD/DEAH box helicase [Candidatus Ozemobacteraceae bacterium]
MSQNFSRSNFSTPTFSRPNELRNSTPQHRNDAERRTTEHAGSFNTVQASATTSAPKPATPSDIEFSSFGLFPALNQGLKDLGFTRPTPIQAQSIPPALLGRDVLACAMTGSGKTAAFMLPILNRLLQGGAGKTRVLVLSPTRELAAQIAEHTTELARHTALRVAPVFGGVGMGPQQAAFTRGVEIIIATPGRLLDHFQYDYAKLSDLNVLVLDEADRMLDMGFLPDIRRVMRHLPNTPRQTLFFSATMPAPIAELSREMLRNPVAIDIERPSKPATGIAQTVYPVSSELKTKLLLKLLEDKNIKNVLAFTRTKHRANRLADFLDRHGVKCARIHGNRSQLQRTQALAGFKDGDYRVLVATDIAARGIDIEALSHVVNFDVPHIVEDYIHRIGRTARASMVGDALTLVAPDEENDLRQIERHLTRRLPRATLADFDYSQKPDDRLEIPLGERIAAIRARKSEERARARAKVEAKNARILEQFGQSNGGRSEQPKRQTGYRGGYRTQQNTAEAPARSEYRTNQPQTPRNTAHTSGNQRPPARTTAPWHAEETGAPSRDTRPRQQNRYGR